MEFASLVVGILGLIAGIVIFLIQRKDARTGPKEPDTGDVIHDVYKGPYPLSIPNVNSFIGREEDLESLELAFEKNILVAIRGLEGTGKTYLVAQFARLKLDSTHKIFWLDCKDWLCLETFISDLGYWAGTHGENALQDLCSDNRRKPEQKMRDVIHLMNMGSCVLIFDNYHLVTDEKMHDFIKHINMWGGKLRVILITNFRGTALQERIPNVNENILKGLRTEIAVKYLKNLNLEEPEEILIKIADGLGGHPLMLSLFAANLRNYHYKSEKLLAKYPETIAEMLDNQVDAKLGENERLFIQSFSVFRNPVPKEALLFVYNMPDLDQVLESLFDKFLINFTKDNEIAIHDVIRKYFYAQLPEKKTSHVGAGKYYVDVKMDSLEGQLKCKLEANYHISKAGDSEKAAEIVRGFADLAYIGQGWYRWQELLLDLLDNAIHAVENPDPWLYLHRARILSFMGQSEERWESILQAQNGFGLISDQFGMATVMRVKGVFYHLEGNYKLAIKSFMSCLKAFEAQNKLKEVAITFQRLGASYTLKSEYSEAIEAYKKSQEIFELIKEPVEVAWLIYGMGRVAREQARYPEALDYINDAKQRFQKLDNKQGVATSLYGIGDIHRFEDRLQKAKAIYETALSMAEELHDTNLVLHLKIEIGQVYCLTSDYKNSISTLKSSLGGLEEINNKAGVAYASRYLGKTYLDMGKLDQALTFLFKSLEIDKDIVGLKGLAEDNLWIGETYEQQGKQDLAREHLRAALDFYRKMDFGPGITKAQQALMRIKEMEY